MPADRRTEVAVVGAGIAGIATAYYLASGHGITSVLLIDPRQPMSFTSAQSGDNYRNWWPHATMAAFTNDSIERMRALSRASNDVFNMTSRGYVLATRRADIESMLGELPAGIDVDVCSGQDKVAQSYPALSGDIVNVIHTRTGGDISGQLLGNFMLESLREAGGKRLQGEVVGIAPAGPFDLDVKTADGRQTIRADVVVNAAGPFIDDVAGMLGHELPVRNVFQQKIAFEDVLGAIPRDMPFSIDLDGKTLDWTDEERALLEADDELKWLARPMPGGTHCRPDGVGKWVKLGWAYNDRPSEPQQDLANEPALDPQFPEIVNRGAAAFIPSLAPYVESPPARFAQYGGYYTMTEENWPLIGPAGPDGAYLVGALSGFGSMSACAAGDLCAAWIADGDLPDYATALSLSRYDDLEALSTLQQVADKGLL